MACYRPLTVLPFSLLLALTGCGGVRTDYSNVHLAGVRGVVKLDGLPLADAVVVFEATDQTHSFATTDESGNYRLMFNTEKVGVTPGPKVVRIRTRGGIEEGDDTIDGEGASEETAVEQVPGCYNAESKLHVTVEPGSQRFDFDLKSDCSVTYPNSAAT